MPSWLLSAVVAVGLILDASAILSREPQNAVPAGDRIFGLTRLHKIRITVSAAEWAVLQTSGARGGAVVGGSDYRGPDGRLIHAGSGFGGYVPWVRADVRVAGVNDVGGAAGAGSKAEFFKDVGLRCKGNFSFTRSSAAAPLFANFKLKIDVHDTKGTWDGEKTFNLHAGVVDTSKMRDAIGFSIFRAAGVPAPRAAFAELISSSSRSLEADREAIQKEADAKIEARREAIIKQLQALQDQYAKAGKLDEAVAIRDFLKAGGPDQNPRVSRIIKRNP